MPLVLNESFLRKIPGDLSIAQPRWRFRTKGVKRLTLWCRVEIHPASSIQLPTNDLQINQNISGRQMVLGRWGTTVDTSVLLKTQLVTMSAGLHLLVPWYHSSPSYLQPRPGAILIKASLNWRAVTVLGCYSVPERQAAALSKCWMWSLNSVPRGSGI